MKNLSFFKENQIFYIIILFLAMIVAGIAHCTTNS
jgi:hypothetical protein